MEDWLCWPRLVAAWAVSPEVGGWGGGRASRRPTTRTCTGHARGHRLAPSFFPAWDLDQSGGNSLPTPPTPAKMPWTGGRSKDKSGRVTCAVRPSSPAFTWAQVPGHPTWGLGRASERAWLTQSSQGAGPDSNPRQGVQGHRAGNPAATASLSGWHTGRGPGQRGAHGPGQRGETRPRLPGPGLWAPSGGLGACRERQHLGL